MANIKTLKDSNNEIVYPQTVISAIFSSDNKTLEAILNAKMDADKAYTKEEVNTMIGTLSSLKISVLQEGEDLPAVGSTDTIYLKKKITSQTQNAYDEYIYLENGTYEKIGDTEIDLTSYLKTTDADTKYAKLEKYSDTTINVGRKSGTTVGFKSVAEGGTTTASGDYSHAEGSGTSATSICCHAEGSSTTASGDYSHAEGRYTTATGSYSHAEGSGTEANGQCSHAEGNDAKANGYYSHAEGRYTTATGDCSHAEGSHTTAMGNYSHAEGDGAKANGYCSHAEGNNTTTTGDYQHVQGRFNISDTTKAHIVGNGNSNSNRSNAHTLDWSGNAWYQGNIKTGGTSYNDAPNTVITSGSVVKVWTGTQTDYEAITTKDPATLYLITG